MISETILISIVMFIVFYILPSAICYWDLKVNKDNNATVSMCFIPPLNVIFAFFCCFSLYEHYFPTPEDPNYISEEDLFRQALDEMEKKSEIVIKRKRRQGYAFEFIKQQKMLNDFDDYCDAMELMREFDEK